jgi:regulatory protein
VLRKRRPKARACPDAASAQAPAEPLAPGDPLAEALSIATAWLARRDHCCAELAARLERRGLQQALIEQVLAELCERRYLDDERYAREFVRAHAGRGQGPLRIRYELVGAGVPAALSEAALQHQAAEQGSWGLVARRVRQRRFGEALPEERTERARQARFLQSRGFSTDHIRMALGASAPDEPDAEPPDPT